MRLNRSVEVLVDVEALLLAALHRPNERHLELLPGAVGHEPWGRGGTQVVSTPWAATLRGVAIRDTHPYLLPGAAKKVRVGPYSARTLGRALG